MPSEEIRKELDDVWREMSFHTQWLGELEEKIKDIEEKVHDIKEEIDDISYRLDGIEKTLHLKYTPQDDIEDLRDDVEHMHDRLDELEHRMKLLKAMIKYRDETANIEDLIDA